jgi:5-methylcytosine-specific restriction endonuclease McrA
MIIQNEKVKGLSKGSNKFVDVQCDVCGKITERRYNAVSKYNNHFCSKECESTYRENKVRQKMNVLVGMDFKEYLQREYIDNKKTIRQLAKMIYNNEKMQSSVLRWLHKFEIPLRQGGEAVAVQWLNNEERRKKTSELAKKNLLNPEVRAKMAEYQKTEEYREKSSIVKRGNLNPMYGKRGELNPRYDKSIPLEERISNRKTYFDIEFRKAVMLKYDYTCQKCGKRQEKNMIAHHIFGFRNNPALRYTPENGIVFCKKCHIAFHKQFGTKDNNSEQLREFLQ